MTNDINDVPRPSGDSKRRRVIPTSGAPRRGPVGFTILVVSKRCVRVDVEPHTADTRTVTIDEDGARVLRGALTGWLR